MNWSAPPARRFRALTPLIVLLAAGCTRDVDDMTSPAPSVAWAPGGSAAEFSVPPVPEAAETPEAHAADRPLGLAELIDLGQRTNPATRIAWEQARQAAAAVGMVEGAYLPFITANVIAGRQEITTPLPTLGGGTDYVTTTAEGALPNIALQWLLFDFGERDGLLDAAERNAYAANVAFNGTHQLLIQNISRAYFQHDAALRNRAIARQALANANRLRDAARSRYENGVGTTIETAQAAQIVAEAKFRQVEAENAARDSYLDLLGAVGLPPQSRIEIAPMPDVALPAPEAAPTDRIIRQALARRPDVLASYAAIEASEAERRAVEASFMPKVFLSAVAAGDHTSLQTGSLPGVGLQDSSLGILVGVTFPLFDGGIRDNRLRRAKSAAEAAVAAHEQTRDAAIREIVVASDTLRSALASHEAATELRRAAQVSFDASFDAYRNGLGTLTDVAAADEGLLDARQAQSDARAASLISAATLAFSLGEMTSSAAPARALGG